MDKLIKIIIRILISTAIVWLISKGLLHIAETNEGFGAFWKLPAILLVKLTLLILIYLLLVKLLPIKKLPLIKNKAVATITLLAGLALTLTLVVLPIFFSLFLLSGYFDYNQFYSDDELPPNSSNINVSQTDTLNKFQGKRLELLERYFSSNKKWNVRHWDNRKVAFLKNLNDGDWEI